MVPLRVYHVLGLIFCINVEAFRKFRRFAQDDENICSNKQFITQGTTLSKCVQLCDRSTECKRLFHIADGNICMRCPSLEVKTANTTMWLSYVLSANTMLYLGCYVDGRPRAMTGASTTNSLSMTNEYCLQFCLERGFMYFATQSNDECFCDNTYDRYGEADETMCNYACVGNTSQMCGGRWRNSVYFIT